MRVFSKQYDFLLLGLLGHEGTNVVNQCAV